ncbi:MAG: sirohydrochlorin cobaltochelatase [Syntrophobacteraceae bacterium]
MRMKMRKRWLFTSAWLVGLVLVTATCFAAHGEKRTPKKAILLAAFGTTVPEAQKAFNQVEARVRQAFPGIEVRWAYTSSIVRAKLARQGKVLPSPESALAKLMEDGYTQVAVLSLHTIPGEEFHDLNRNAHLFGQMAGGFENILVARPLLSSREDMERVAKAMLKNIPADRKPGDAVVLMGHGTEKHPSDAVYLALYYTLRELDPNVHVATVDGYPALKDILPKLKEKKIGKVYLMPFMAVAGDHARNDMAGDKPDSWKSVLGKEGFTCEAVLKGTAEYPEIVDVWLSHLRAVLSHFE